jgi:hypothetical protein
MIMRKFILASVAVLGLGLVAAQPAMADSKGTALVGTAGAATGGTIGFLLGGPIGAVIGGFTGALVGTSVVADDVDAIVVSDLAISEDSVAYARNHPKAEIAFAGDLSPGVKISGDFDLNRIPDDADYGYLYIDGRPVLIDRHSHVIVWVG